MNQKELGGIINHIYSETCTAKNYIYEGLDSEAYIILGSLKRFMESCFEEGDK